MTFITEPMPFDKTMRLPPNLLAMADLPVTADFAGLPLEALELDECRWPIAAGSDGRTRFCAEPVAAGAAKAARDFLGRGKGGGSAGQCLPVLSSMGRAAQPRASRPFAVTGPLSRGIELQLEARQEAVEYAGNHQPLQAAALFGPETLEG